MAAGAAGHIPGAVEGWWGPSQGYQSFASTVAELLQGKLDYHSHYLYLVQ